MVGESFPSFESASRGVVFLYSNGINIYLGAPEEWVEPADMAFIM